MLKRRSFSKLMVFLIVFSLSFLALAQFALIKADMVVLREDGEVVLVTEEDVLAVTTPPTQNPPNAPEPKKDTKTPSPATKTVSLAPPNKPTVIQTNPSKDNNKKLDVTIQGTPITSVSPSAPSSPPKVNPTISSSPVSKTSLPAASLVPNLSPPAGLVKPSIIPSISPLPNPSPTPNTTPPDNQSQSVNKQVDQVILQGKSSEPVLTIKSAEQNQITLSQGGTEVTTNLSFQINNQTHSLSSVSPTGNSRINVLPREAVNGAIQQGYIQSNPNTTQPTDTKATLSQEGSSAFYNIKGEKTGKLFGVIPVKSAVEVKMSAETGKVVNVAQSPVFSFLGIFIK